MRAVTVLIRSQFYFEVAPSRESHKVGAAVVVTLSLGCCSSCLVVCVRICVNRGAANLETPCDGLVTSTEVSVLRRTEGRTSE
jgi:hypothetical protein